MVRLQALHVSLAIIQDLGRRHELVEAGPCLSTGGSQFQAYRAVFLPFCADVSSC